MEQQNTIEEDFEILNTYIDPTDVKALDKKTALLNEIESEKTLMKAKYIYRYALQESDPFKLWS